MCLATDETEELKLQDCSGVAAHDTWEVPRQGGSFNNIKSTSKEKCLVPVEGQGPRKLQLQECTEDTAKWKNDEAKGGERGMCTVRWPVDQVKGETKYGAVPHRRSCFATTGSDIGKWSSEIVVQASIERGFSQQGGRLDKHSIGTRPLPEVKDPHACSHKCKETVGCRAFNYEQGTKSCDLLSATVSDAAPMDFEDGGPGCHFTMAGQPSRHNETVPQECTDDLKTAAVRCCSDGDAIGSTPEECFEVSYAEAVQKCEAAGKRLCATQAELEKTKGTGCDFDDKRSWTSALPDHEPSSWDYYEPKDITVDTKCQSNCLPDQVSRLEYPQTGIKFSDSPGLLPDIVAGRFDAIVFGAAADLEMRAQCYANVDAITIEVQSYCQAAKTTLCRPEDGDPSGKEKCETKKEAACRRLLLLPTTFFSASKAEWRTKCGHMESEDGKVWHEARMALDTCAPVVGLRNFCGSIESLL